MSLLGSIFLITQPPPPTLTDQPVEILAQIAVDAVAHTPEDNVTRLCLLDKKFKKVCSDKEFWKQVVFRTWGLKTSLDDDHRKNYMYYVFGLPTRSNAERFFRGDQRIREFAYNGDMSKFDFDNNLEKLASLKHLETLSLFEVSDNDIIEVSKVLMNMNNKTLRRLSLLKTGARQDISNDAVLSLCNFLETNSSVKLLHFEKLVFEEEHAKNIIDALIERPKKISLILRRNEMRDNAASEIIRLLNSNKIGGIFNISGNAIDENTMEIIIQSLPNSPSIRILIINDQFLGGNNMLAAYLETNPEIFRLELDDSPMETSDEAIIIANSLTSNSNLKQLSLSNNWLLNNETVMQMFMPILENNSLEELNLHASPLDDDILERLAYVYAESNESLQRLELTFSEFTYPKALNVFSEYLPADTNKVVILDGINLDSTDLTPEAEEAIERGTIELE